MAAKKKASRKSYKERVSPNPKTYDDDIHDLARALVDWFISQDVDANTGCRAMIYSLGCTIAEDVDTTEEMAASLAIVQFQLEGLTSLAFLRKQRKQVLRGYREKK